MKPLFHAIVFFFLICSITNAAEPNYVKTTVVGVGKEGTNPTDQVNITFTDGLGREIQSKVNNGTVISGENISESCPFLTSCTFYDDAGRPIIATKAFNNNSILYKPGTFNDINSILKSQYSSFPKNNSTDDPLAYSETKYYDDPLSRLYQSILPGVDNVSQERSSSKVWYFGVGKKDVITDVTLGNQTIKMQKGFFISELTSGQFDELANSSAAFSNAFPDELDYQLTVTMDAGGKFTQTLKDLFGRTVATAARKTGGEGLSKLIISETHYDILGNVLTEKAPLQDGTTALLGDTKYQYNTLGQVIRKETPDGAIEKYTYNEAGLLQRKELYTVENASEKFLILYNYRYDELQRLKTITLAATGREPYVENFYDNTDNISKKLASSNIPSDVFNTLKNLRGRLVATLCRNYVNGVVYQVIDLYGYDEDGNLSIKYKQVPGLSLQKIEYTYDIHGKKLSERIIAGVYDNTKCYTYDNLGRLKYITPSNDPAKKLAEYTYNNFGQLEIKTRNGNIVSKYEYSINEQLKKIFNGKQVSQFEGIKIFEENLRYKKDGNINDATMSYNGFTGAPSSIVQNYTYDNLNRLIRVGSGESTPEYASNYMYDDAGRIKNKVEGTSNLSGYQYFANTSRIKKKQTSGNDDYVFDQLGNLILDKSKKMVIEYDWRNLPIKFSFYNTIPDAIGTNSKGECLINNGSFSGSLTDYMTTQVAGNNGIRLLSTVVMLYDASGNRVLKTEGVQ